MKNNTIQLSLFIYLVSIVIFIQLKPNFIYKQDGSLKSFGSGKDNTIFPLWLIIFMMAFLSYYISHVLIIIL